MLDSSFYSCVRLWYSHVYHGNVIAYDMKKWGNYYALDRLADTIYAENFKTGDILIYRNENDIQYEFKDNNLFQKLVTYENGEYAFIFLAGKGFVGVNYGKDGLPATLDDRNEFNIDYYIKHNLKVYSNQNEKNKKILAFANYQTLFAKDYYVILRPSLGLFYN